MIRPKHCLAILAFIFALSLVACIRTQKQAPSIEREVQEVRNRTVPKDGRLVATSRPVKNDFDLHATWDIETTSDNRSYFQWLKSQLSPEYHVTAETASTIRFIIETVGDSYSLEFRRDGTSGRPVIHASFIALAD